MEQLPSELMINIITQVIRQRYYNNHIHHHHNRNNNKSNNKNSVKKKQAAETYLQWTSLRLVCKKWYSLASLCAVYPKYERKKLVYLAKIAEEASQYEEMVEIVNSIARLDMEMEMSEEERQTFADAYKHLTNNKRLSWKTIQTIEQQLINKYNKTNPPITISNNLIPPSSPLSPLSPLLPLSPSILSSSSIAPVSSTSSVSSSVSSPISTPSSTPIGKSILKDSKLISKCCGGTIKESNIRLATNYRLKIEDELRAICNLVFEILDASIVPHITTTEGKVFFMKMRADYLRYLAEISTYAPERQDYVTHAQRSYAQASRLATVELRPSHPLCLSLGLSFALFFSEVLNEPDRGSKMAKATFDAAVGEMEMDARRQSAGMPMWTDDMLDDLRTPKK